MSHPRYPIYVISKGRYDLGLTAKCFIKDKINFHLVVEPQEADAYSERFGIDKIYVLPFSNLGQGSIPARNWVWEHSKEKGYKRHWIIDDNIRHFRRYYKGKRIACNAGFAFMAVEDFTDRYENIGISGMNYTTFVINRRIPEKPFTHNVSVYSCMLINNQMSYRWRGKYNEDTDLCLQVLSGGWCTILTNAFMIDKQRTMISKGGNTDELYQGDGRLKMARSLERMWPGVVQTKRRWKRPQHRIKNSWLGFDTPLKLKEGIDLNQMEPNEYGMELKQISEIKSPSLKKLIR